MAFSKANKYPINHQSISEHAKSIAHPARQEILLFLLIHGSSCVQKIAEGHPISKVAISDHLAILREDHLITYDERYPYTFYELDKSTVRKAVIQLRSFLNHFDELLK